MLVAIERLFVSVLYDAVEVIDIEGFAQAAGAIPVGHLPGCAEPPELVEDVRPHRRHAGTAADEHHLRLGLLREELAEGPGDGHVVARLQIEEI